MAEKTTIDGVTELSGALKDHAKDVDTRVSRLMVAAGGRVLKTEAKRLALAAGLKRTGALLANIAIKREKNAPKGTTQYNLGVRHGRDLGRKAAKMLQVSKISGRVVTVYKDDPFYWIFHEFGWIPRGRGKALRGGDRSKRAQREKLTQAGKKREATPFIGKSLENKRAEAIDAMERRLQAAIEKGNK